MDGGLYRARGFESTRWSIVLRARDGSASQALEALEFLCRSYWYLLYCFIRRAGHTEEEAKDLAQGFFEHLLAEEALKRVDSAKGRFRSFLLASLTNFLHNERARAATLKRGGGRNIVSWDQIDPEERYRREPASRETPDELFARSWAWALMQQALHDLRDEYARSGKAEVFDSLQRFITTELTGEECAGAGASLGIAEGAVKVALHRLRRRFGEFVRTRVADTVSDPEEIDDELRHLFAAVHSLV